MHNYVVFSDRRNPISYQASSDEHLFWSLLLIEYPLDCVWMVIEKDGQFLEDEKVNDFRENLLTKIKKQVELSLV